MTFEVRAGGTWKTIGADGISVKVGGSWKTVDAAYVKVAGVWKQVFSNYNSATGGSISTVNNYNGSGEQWKVHTFTSNGTFTVIDSPRTFRVLCIAGGGASGTNYGAGAGAGGMIDGTYSIPTGARSVTVGSGGSGFAFHTVGNNGGASSLSGIVSTSGGGGGGNQSYAGRSGGSGGGGSRGQAGGSGVSGQGFPGSYGADVWAETGAGGGAGRTAGTNGSGAGLAGGLGKASNITGSNTTYAYGGSGVTYGGTQFSNPFTYGSGAWAEGRSGKAGVVIISYRSA